MKRYEQFAELIRSGVFGPLPSVAYHSSIDIRYKNMHIHKQTEYKDYRSLTSRKTNPDMRLIFKTLHAILHPPLSSQDICPSH